MFRVGLVKHKKNAKKFFLHFWTFDETYPEKFLNFFGRRDFLGLFEAFFGQKCLKNAIFFGAGGVFSHIRPHSSLEL